MRGLLALILAAFMGLAAPSLAQEAPALVADSIIINPDQTLIAQGAVEILYKGQRLTARRLTYNQQTNLLQIEGPIMLDDGNGAVLLADSGELSSDFRNGILTSARLVLQDRLQIAAQQINRVDGRYTQLSRVVASSCQVCAAHPVPLWEIRAARVVHDQQARQLYYDHAQFRFAGLPILYLPRLRTPDPTLNRATGFLLPTFSKSSNLGFGVKLPYFIALGQSRDITLTPFVALNDAHALFLRYRQAFGAGSIELNGALAQDGIIASRDIRAYLFGTGTFDLGDKYRLGFQLETSSDNAVLLDYGISEKDRLASGIYLQRVTRDRYFDARLFKYKSLRTGDDNLVQPNLVGDLVFARRMTPDIIGGQALLTFDLHGLNRASTVPTDANGDGVTDGRDMTRATLGLSWRRQEVLGNGMIAAATFALAADMIAVREDLAYPATITRTTPAAALDLRWPLVKSSKSGTQVLEPVAQLIWSPDTLIASPNEDSALVEFDEGNLFSFSRFPGSDIYERGLRTNLGVNWTDHLASGWTIRLSAGRVLRSDDLAQFSTGSRLAGTRSDWLLALQAQSADGLTVTNRGLFDDSLKFSKDELRLQLSRARYDLSANYVWLVADPAEGRPTATSELAIETAWRFREGWSASANGRYDFLAADPTRIGGSLEYRNECAAFNLSLSRRFTSSTTVKPTTEIGLAVRLYGFGGGSPTGSVSRSCGG